jgi:hypothetical protein
MKKLTDQKWFPHVASLIIGLTMVVVYMNPMLSGKVLKQYDVKQWLASYNEVYTYQEQTGDRTFWTNSIFSGMPTYLIGPTYKHNFTNEINMFIKKVLPNPIDTIFLLFACFYILLIAFEVNAWWAIAGAAAFMLSTFNFINIDAGHVSKGDAIAYMPLVLAGIQITLRKNMWFGALLTGVALSFQLTASHLQITYYLMMLIMAWMVAEVFWSIKEKQIKRLVLSGLIMAGATVLGIGTNATNLMATREYKEYSIRGASELNKTAQGNDYENVKSSGLDKDYALQWSNGTMEPFTLLIPNFYGGANSGDPHTHDLLTKHFKSEGFAMAKELAQGTPAYFGEQPFTAGPIYYGAIICFLFVLGLLLIKSPLKWWVLAISVLAIMLSMGKNFISLTDLFFYNFPLYNNFRSVTFILAITQTTFPLLALLAIKEIIDNKHPLSEVKQKLLYALGITGGLCAIFVLMPGIVSVSSVMDEQLIAYKYPMDLIYSGREKVRQMDALRSLVFILLSFGLIWVMLLKKISHQAAAFILLALVTIDLWGVNKRYLNDSDFEKKRKNFAEYFPKSEVDQYILQDKDIHYRVYNSTMRLDQDAMTSFWHKTISGYHGAKMRRYQELIEFHLARGNAEAYNMLNVKYIIYEDKNNKRNMVDVNPEANGNAWFVQNINWVANADEEIDALTELKTKTTTIIDKRFENQFTNFIYEYDSTASIKLTSYTPNKLVYQTNAQSNQVAVFSEVHYDKGWKAYLDGVEMPHFRCNYVLRGMTVPAGEHTIEFKFEPEVIAEGENISLMASIMLYGGLLAVGGFSIIRSRRKEDNTQTQTNNK